MGKKSLNSSTTGTPKASPKAKVPKSPLQMTPGGKKGRKSLSKRMNDSPKLTELVKEEAVKSAKKGKKSLNMSVAGTPKTELKTPKKQEVKPESSSESEDAYDSAEETVMGSEKPSKQQKISAKKVKEENEPKKYNLFVGQLGLDITAADIKEHFGKVATVLSARIPTYKDSGRTRRFGFVEVASQSDYDAALGLHNSHLKGSRLTVEYTCAGSKKSTKRSAKIKAKTLKLRSLQEQGILSKEDKLVTPAKQTPAKKTPAKKTPGKATMKTGTPGIQGTPGKKGLKGTPKKV